MFKFTGSYFMNIKGKTLTLTTETNMSHLFFRVKNTKNKWNGLDQKWSLKYMDELPKPPKKGDWCGEYGFHHMRDFHLVSALPAHRYLDYLGADTVIKVPNGRTTQTWYFDWNSRSIRSRAVTSKNINIASSNRVLVGTIHSK
jgi:hypothetical protein